MVNDKLAFLFKGSRLSWWENNGVFRSPVSTATKHTHPPAGILKWSVFWHSLKESVVRQFTWTNASLSIRTQQFFFSLYVVLNNLILKRSKPTQLNTIPTRRIIYIISHWLGKNICSNVSLLTLTSSELPSKIISWNRECLMYEKVKSHQPLLFILDRRNFMKPDGQGKHLCLL